MLIGRRKFKHGWYSGIDRTTAHLRGMTSANATIDRCHAPPLRSGETGYVYVISSGKYVKIGWSRNVRSRLFGLQASNPETIFVHAIIPATEEAEIELHQRFSKQRRRYEWFNREGSLQSWIDDGCPLGPQTGEHVSRSDVSEQ